MHWSPAIGAEHLGTRERAGLFDESSFAKIEVSGPGAATFLESLCDNRVARGSGRHHLHADAQLAGRDRVRLHGHPGRGGTVLDRHRHGLRQPRPVVDPLSSPGRRVGARRRRHRALGMLRPLGAARSGDPRAADPGRRQRGGLSVHDDAGDHHRRRPGPSPAGHVRRRARLGAVLPDRVRRRVCGARCGRAAGPTGSSPAGYKAIDTLRLEKGYRVWAADITPDETPVRGRARLLRQARQAGRFRRARGARSRARRTAFRGACAASCSRTRARSRSATSRFASMARWSAG